MIVIKTNGDINVFPDTSSWGQLNVYRAVMNVIVTDNVTVVIICDTTNDGIRIVQKSYYYYCNEWTF